MPKKKFLLFHLFFWRKIHPHNLTATTDPFRFVLIQRTWIKLLCWKWLHVGLRRKYWLWNWVFLSAFPEHIRNSRSHIHKNFCLMLLNRAMPENDLGLEMESSEIYRFFNIGTRIRTSIYPAVLVLCSVNLAFSQSSFEKLEDTLLYHLLKKQSGVLSLTDS